MWPAGLGAHFLLAGVLNGLRWVGVVFDIPERSSGPSRGHRTTCATISIDTNDRFWAVLSGLQELRRLGFVVQADLTDMI